MNVALNKAQKQLNSVQQELTTYEALARTSTDNAEGVGVDQLGALAAGVATLDRLLKDAEALAKREVSLAKRQRAQAYVIDPAARQCPNVARLTFGASWA